MLRSSPAIEPLQQLQSVTGPEASFIGSLSMTDPSGHVLC